MENVFTLQEIFSDKIFRVPNYHLAFHGKSGNVAS